MQPLTDKTVVLFFKTDSRTMKFNQACVFVAAALTICCHRLFVLAQFDCRLMINYPTDLEFWQSWTWNQSAGITGSQSEPEFKSAVGISAADAGYHWIVIKLEQPIWTDQIILSSSSEIKLTERIEVWTTGQAVSFGSENRPSKTIISSVFAATRNQWSFCGATQKVTSKAGQRVSCRRAQKCHQVLLRKYVMNITDSAMQCMAFSLMVLNKFSAEITLEPSPVVKSNSSVTMRCNLNCIDNPTDVRLVKLKTNETLAIGNQVHLIESVNEDDKGEYACLIGDVAVSTASLQFSTHGKPSEHSKIYIFLFVSCGSFICSLLIAAVAIYLYLRKSTRQRKTTKTLAGKVDQIELPSSDQISDKNPADAGCEKSHNNKIPIGIFNGSANEHNSCTYAAIIPELKNCAASSIASQSSRPDSELTVFLEIVSSDISGEEMTIIEADNAK